MQAGSMTGKDKLITAATLGTLAILLFHECATSGRKGPVAAEPPADEVGVVAEAAGLHDALDAAQTSANEFRVTQAETNAAVFLASDAASYMTGTTMDLTGGMMMR